MELAAEGYPESGLNYDIFSGASSFGITDREMEAYTQYQLQENLRTTILKLQKIKDCIVIVNLPSKSVFVLSSNERPASASVMLEVKNGRS
jgi:flagellar M-ring protein FliF